MTPIQQAIERLKKKKAAMGWKPYSDAIDSAIQTLESTLPTEKTFAIKAWQNGEKYAYTLRKKDLGEDVQIVDFNQYWDTLNDEK